MLPPTPRSGVRTGLEYVAVVFAIGFGFGVLRELWAAQALGRLTAELFELPIMVGLSWLVCGWLIRRHRLAAPTPVRFTMAATALLVLAALEVVVALALRRMSADEYIGYLMSLHGLLAWLGYLAFAAAPFFLGR